MKRLAGVVVCVFLATSAIAAEELPWEKQLNEMGYYILRTSSINLVNGLNLTVDQATRLRALAATLEPYGPKRPSPTSKFGQRLAPVKAAYTELEALLLKGEEVPKELHGRLASARTIEADEIRKSLVNNPSERGCAQCHTDPATRQGSGRLLDRSDFNPKAMGAGHSTDLWGQAGTVKLWKAASEVESILTEAQLSVVKDFTCCITPPRSLKDPVRVGQAAISETALETLKYVRTVPEARWSVTRAIMLKKSEERLLMAYPGISAAERTAQSERLGKALDKARGLSDLDFELEKENLAKDVDMKQAQKPANVANIKVKPGFQASLFLMLPGATEAYDRLIERIKKNKDAPVAQVDLKTVEGADNCSDGHCALKKGGNMKPGEK